MPKWVVAEVNKVNRKNKEIQASMTKIENWLKVNELIKNESDGMICSLVDEKSLIERADIESGLWTGENLDLFLKTGKIN